MHAYSTAVIHSPWGGHLGAMASWTNGPVVHNAEGAYSAVCTYNISFCKYQHIYIILLNNIIIKDIDKF